MLKQIMDHPSGKMDSEAALKILEAEAKPKWHRDWPLFVLLILYGFAASSAGTQSLLLFTCLATCLAVSNHRSQLRSASIAQAALTLFEESEAPSESSDNKDLN